MIGIMILAGVAWLAALSILWRLWQAFSTGRAELGGAFYDKKEAPGKFWLAIAGLLLCLLFSVAMASMATSFIFQH